MNTGFIEIYFMKKGATNPKAQAFEHHVSITVDGEDPSIFDGFQVESSSVYDGKATASILKRNLLKQVIVVRKDLKMRRGKEITQGSHASVTSYNNTHTVNPEMADFWYAVGQRKITCSVNSLEELNAVCSNARNNLIRENTITDMGLTEFNGVPTVTCAAIGIDFAPEVDKITNNLKLY